MGRKSEGFNISGPTYLNNVNWKDENHQRAIVASLVRGAYILERDRQKNRTGDEALAPQWWQFFNFELHRELIDTKDDSYFGAIFKFRSPTSCDDNSNNQPPRYIIAFRGTLIRRKTFLRDFKLDLSIIVNEIHHTTRFKDAMEAVSRMIEETAEEGTTTDMIWLAGHSLGSSLALAVGKRMAQTNYHFKTYLFNSPFSAIPLEIFGNNRMVKHLLRFAKNGLTAGVSKIINDFSSLRIEDSQTSNDFSHGWVPHIFLNSNDFVCAEYVGFFKNRELMCSIGAQTIAKLSNKNSLVSLTSMIFGRHPEPSYLLHSAFVSISPTKSGSPHQLDQWWSFSLDCESELRRLDD